ncbi:hypothetical protein Dimus_018810 [Dionaea muscipula]
MAKHHLPLLPAGAQIATPRRDCCYRSVTIAAAPCYRLPMLVSSLDLSSSPPLPSNRDLSSSPCTANAKMMTLMAEGQQKKMATM